MNYGRNNHAITYLNNYIYVVGGNKEQDENSAFDKCERMSTLTEKWEVIASCKFKSSGCSICAFNNRFIYKFGGKTDFLNQCN